MTPSTLAETILRDVKRYSLNMLAIEMFETPHGGWVKLPAVEAALSRALDPAIAERAGELAQSDDPKVMLYHGEYVEALRSLLAQNAALRAERDEHAEALKVNNAVLCAALLRAKDAEAQIAALPAATVGVPLKQIGTGLYEQPAPNPAAIREAWEKAYWRMRSYAVHDNDCKLNKPPHFDGPCSCGLTAALEDALALIQMEEQK